MQYNFDSNLSKRISFILSTKNRSAYLQKALEQCCELVGSDDELIVIDGGSKNSTQEIIEMYSTIVNIYVSEPDESEGHAFNKGILLTSGKYIKPLTDDDIFYPEAIDQAVALMEKNSDIDLLITGGTKNKNGTESVVFMREGSDFGKNVESLYRNSWCGIGFLIRKSSLSKAGIFEAESTALDMSIATQFINKGLKVRFARINMFYHPIYEHSGTNLKQKAWEEDYNRICKQYCSRTFYFNFKWNILRRKHKWLPHFDLMVLPYRSIRVLLTKGPNSFIRKAKKRIFKEDGSDMVMDKSPEVVWDGSIADY